MVVSNVINDLIDFFFLLWSKWPSFFHLGSRVAITVWKMSLSARTAQNIFTEVHQIILMTFAHFHSALSCGLTRSPSLPRKTWGGQQGTRALSQGCGRLHTSRSFLMSETSFTQPTSHLYLFDSRFRARALIDSSGKIYLYCSWICKC